MNIAGLSHRRVVWITLAIVASVTPSLRAQRNTPTSAPATRAYTVPPAPALSQQEEIKTFKLQPGYRVECIAAEPLVHDPIAMSIDPDGRLWVCEMRGFMPDLDQMNEM